MIAFKLFNMQVLDYTTYMAKVKAQTNRVEELHSKRGTITDRNGEILAISLQAKSAFISNKDSALSLAVFKKFCGLLPVSNAQKINIVKRIRRGEKFIWLKRKLTDEEYLKVTAPGRGARRRPGTIDFLDEYRRVYPQKRIASHVLGGVGIDEQALGGIETSLDSEIKGRGGKLKVLIDARKKIFQFKIPGAAGAGPRHPPEHRRRPAVLRGKGAGGRGRNNTARPAARSSSWTAATARSWPWPATRIMSRKNIWNTPLPVLKNKAISFLYDPGSTFKIVLAASALENRACGRQETFDCHNGRLRRPRPPDRRRPSLRPALLRRHHRPFEQHRRRPDRHAPGRGQIFPDHRPLRLRPPHRHPAAGRGERHPQSRRKNGAASPWPSSPSATRSR